jgi:glucose-6-phosphate isomerase
MRLHSKKSEFMLLYSQELKNIPPAEASSAQKVRAAADEIRQGMKSDGDLKCLSIAFERDDLADIEKFAALINDNFERLVVMGIGGSSLGAKTLLSVGKKSNVIVLESIDSDTVNRTFENLNLKQTAFLTVSKSGKTIECISQTLIIMKIVEEKLGKNALGKHFFFLTENRENPLNEIAKTFGIRVFEHHSVIGGRFSYLSNTSLMPAAVAGLDIKKIRDGAADVIDFVLNNDNNFVLDICGAQIDMFNNGIAANVTMPYIDKLYFFNEWYRQLWAESLGKMGKGTIPVSAMGTADQHSQLQLYMEGPRNIFYTFIGKNKSSNSLKIRETYAKNLSYLKNLTLDDLAKVEFDSTTEVLNVRKLPLRIINFTELNETSLSQLMTQYIFETIICGKALGLNPFGQHAVEERKILARNMMQKLR